MKVVIIGSGNVARVFGKLILNTRHQLQGFICRNPFLPSAAGFPDSLEIKSFNDKISPADLYIAAVTDTVLSELHKLIAPGQGIIVHTAGSVSSLVLKNIRPKYGVLYPLQSLRKEISPIPPIPLLVDGSDEETLRTIWSLAEDMSNNVSRATDEERSKLHLAAVSSSNFINYLLILVYDYCEKENLNPDLLIPLLQETIGRLHHFSPQEVQTGPAMRNDRNTIKRQLESLNHYPHLKQLYQNFTDLILKRFQHK